MEKSQREAAGKVSAVELQLESERMQAELTRLRAVEAFTRRAPCSCPEREGCHGERADSFVGMGAGRPL